MVRKTLLILATVTAIGPLWGCGSAETTSSTCALDSAALSGQWVSLKGGGEGSDVPDKFSRIAFEEREGKKVALYTAGQLSPGNPATNKYVYQFVQITNMGEAMYVADTMAEAGKSKQRIERLKKDNRRLDVKFEGRLYVSVNKKNCSLTVKDMYATWVKGEEIEDSNASGVRTFIKNDWQGDPRTEELSMVPCDDAGALYFFEKRELDLEKDKALNQRDGVYAEDTVFLHYLPEVEEEAGKDAAALAAAYAKKALTATEGCTYDYEMWMQDTRVKDAQKLPVVPAADGKLAWIHEHKFDKSSAAGLYVEMHRYATCGGARKLLSNACTVVWPNRSRAEYKAEEDAAKAAPADAAGAQGSGEGAE